MGRILCAWSPTWPIANWRRRNSPDGSPEEQAPRSSPPGGGGRRPEGVAALDATAFNPLSRFATAPPEGEHLQPFALLETVRGTRRIAAVSLEAAQLRLYPGQKATDAFALVPELVTAEAEPDADAAALEALAHWCVRFSPAVAIDPPNGLHLDVEGAAHLWGGEAAMLADLRARLAANGLPFRLAIADTAGAAWALAHFGQDGTIAPPGGQEELLALLPPQALRLDPAVAAQIERLGLRRLAQLTAIPRAPFGRRFGAQALMRLDQALGRAGEALEFRRPPTPWFARLAFAEPISAPEDMARVAFDICVRLCAALEAKGQGARRFELVYHRLDGKALSVAVGLSAAGRDPLRLAKLFTPKLDVLDPGFGVEVATLEAHEVEPIAARQTDLAGPLVSDEGLGPLVDRLVNRLGEARVWRAEAAQSHVPERGGDPRPAAGRRPPRRTCLEPRGAQGRCGCFRRPEPVEGVIALTPDDPPSQFRWRGQLHRVRRAEGPERVGEEWWKADIDDVSVGHVRDYYRVEDQDGARYWLFRAGLYEAGQPSKWWLHGVFG